jgi:hypothetical protein
MANPVRHCLSLPVLPVNFIYKSQEPNIKIQKKNYKNQISRFKKKLQEPNIKIQKKYQDPNIKIQKKITRTKYQDPNIKIRKRIQKN